MKPDDEDYYGNVAWAKAQLSPCVACGNVPDPWKYGYWYIRCCWRGAENLDLVKCISG